ncbi:hypothetical protein P3T73_17865 [Kiritimatiellota bacterium B12222]|nr:hypothetical protein P3T73_17865 [Kiritimatiellota bacterium B12222]
MSAESTALLLAGVGAGLDACLPCSERAVLTALEILLSTNTSPGGLGYGEASVPDFSWALVLSQPWRTGLWRGVRTGLFMGFGFVPALSDRALERRPYRTLHGLWFCPSPGGLGYGEASVLDSSWALVLSQPWRTGLWRGVRT